MTAYEELKKRASRPSLSPKIAKERAAERTRRYQEARRRVFLVLADRHREEFERLLLEERYAVDRERGPLPGDNGET